MSEAATILPGEACNVMVAGIYDIAFVMCHVECN